MLINFKMLNIEPRRASAACAMTSESKRHMQQGIDELEKVGLMLYQPNGKAAVM